MFGLASTCSRRAIQNHRHFAEAVTPSAPAMTRYEQRSLGSKLGIVAGIALAVTVGVYFYPELMRTIQMHRM